MTESTKKMILYIIIGIIILGVIFILSSLVSKKRNTEETNYLKGKHKVEIIVKDMGTIRLELDADIAPITVTNFIDLVNDHFYDGLTFHRVINGFMIQAGDPLGTGMGGSSKKIKGEFSKNGVNNPLSHVRGTVSMARQSGNNNSASSQFFIVQEDKSYLDGEYAAFGKVLDGMDVVDQIAKNTKVEDDNGTVLKENQPVITEIRVVQ